MDLDSLNSPICLKPLEELIARNDSGGVASFLGYRRLASPSLDTPLLNASVKADRIRLAAASLDEDLTISRALIRLSPPAYETPWQSSCDVLRRIQTSKSADRVQLRSSVADIQTFLRQVVAIWWEEERKHILTAKSPRKADPVGAETRSNHTPRYWLLKLLQVAMDPLRVIDAMKDSCQEGSSELWAVLLELISTVVELSRDIDDSALLVECLGNVFQQTIRHDRLLPWLNLASELRLYLKDKDWENVRSSVLDALNDNECTVPDLPGVAEALLSITTHVMKGVQRTVVDDIYQWQKLTIRLLLVASRHHTTGSTVEVIHSGLSSLPHRSLQIWTRALVEGPLQDDEPVWIRCNVLLLTLRASRHSGAQIASRMLVRTFGGDNMGHPSIDVVATTWSHLVVLLLPGSSKRRRRGNRSSAVSDEVLHRWSGVAYSGTGNFVHQNEDDMTLSQAGHVVLQTLFLQGTVSRSRGEDLDVVDRAHSLVHVACDIMGKASCGEADVVLALIALVVVYNEIPMCRSLIARRILLAISNSRMRLASENARVSILCNIFVSVVLADTDEAECELGQLSSLLTEPMPLELFMDLAKALLPLPVARRAMLDTSRRALNVLASWEEPGGLFACQHVDRSKCGLFALVLLVSRTKWADCEIEAWSMLSDVIVSCRPTFPAVTRSWLYGQLKRFLARGRMHSSGALHVQRACLCRLLSFFGVDRNGRDSFAPGHSLDGASTLVSQQENIAVLFSLVLDFLRDKLIQGSESTVRAWRAGLWNFILKLDDPSAHRASGLVESIPVSVEKIDFSGEALPVNAAMYAVCLVLLDLLKKDMVVVDPTPPSVAELTARLREQECGSIDWSITRPLWLQRSHVHVIEGTHYPSQTVPLDLGSLRSSLCDAVVAFLTDPTWSQPCREEHNLGSTAIGLSTALCSIFDVKRATHAAKQDCSTDERFVTDASRSRSTETFLALLVAAVEKTVQEQMCFAKFDRFLSVILWNLDDIRVALIPSDNVETAVLYRFVEIVWNVYFRLYREAAACAMIKYLERESLQPDRRTGHETCGSIDSTTEIDSSVRALRVKVLEVLSACLSCVRDNGEPNIIEKESFLSKAARWLETLASDVGTGCEGNSGAVSYELLTLYFTCIGCLVDLISDTFKSCTDRGLIVGGCAACLTARKALLNLQQTYPLKSPVPLKKCVLLTFHAFPEALRSAARSILRQCDDPKAVSDLFEPSSGDVYRSLSDSCNSFVQADQREDDDDSFLDDHDWVLPRARGEMPRDVFEALVRRQSPKEPSTNVSVDIWNATAVLTSIEKAFGAFLLDGDHDMEESFFSQKAALTFAKPRRDEVSSLFSSLCLFFAENVEQAGTHVVDVLPESVTKRLLLVLDKVLLVCLKATKTVSACARNGCYEADGGEVSFAAVDAASCLAGWVMLRTVDRPKRDDEDLTIHVRKWYLNALSSESTDKAASSRVGPIDDDDVLRKLPKCALRSEELELALRNFQLEISGMCKGNGKRNATASFLGTLFCQGTDTPDETSLLSVLKRKCDMLEERIPGLSQMEKAEKRKAELEVARMMKKKRRIPVVRSRNVVIDRWFAMDQEIGEDERIEEDAYVELEDFIADG